MLKLITLLGFATLLLFPSLSVGQTVDQDVGRIQIRIRRPLITLGPTGSMIDNPLSLIKLANGGFRVFTANATTYRIDGADPWSDGATPVAVLRPILNSYASCGQWLNDEQNIGGESYFGYVHAETDCDYAHGQTHKSMALAISTDEGGSWTNIGQIITGSDNPATGRSTGVGDCTAVHDSTYTYLYCEQASDQSLVISRAPKDNPYPGQWHKFYDGQWNQPGLGGLSSPGEYVAEGSSTPIYLGSGSVSTWPSENYTVLLNTNAPQFSPGGVQISFSKDYVNFTSLAQPILVTDGPAWTRNANAPDLIAYPAVVTTSGNRSWGDANDFLLTYTYLAPGEDFSQRKLVFRSAYAWLTATSADGNQPQVGLELSRWIDETSSPQEIWTTTAPVPGNYSTFSYIGSLGYVMTSPLTGSSAPATVELEECTSNWTGNTDHLIDWDGYCVPGGYRRLRTIGWIYKQEQPNTKPLYKCWSPTYYRSHFVSNQSDCEGKGSMEILLGYTF